MLADRGAVLVLSSTGPRSWRAPGSRPPSGARTLLADRSATRDRGRARQSLDQSLLTLERARLHELLEFKQAELSEAEAAEDMTARDRLQQDVLALQRQRSDARPPRDT